MFRTVLLALLGATLATAAVAHEYSAGGITVAHPWVRASQPGRLETTAFLEIKAARGKRDRLKAVSSPIAAAASLDKAGPGGSGAPAPRIDGIDIAAGKSVVLRPDGVHIRLSQLAAPLKEGDLVKLVLVFEKAGSVEVDATVEPADATGPHGFKFQPGHEPQKGGKGHVH